MTSQKVVIYCDGACLGNPGPGGYAGLIMLKSDKKKEKVVAGFEDNTTNNRMELKAAILSLKTLKKPCEVEIYCDSQYVVKGITLWILAWQKNNFKNAQNKPIANQDLWQELFLITKKHKVTWNWVKAHDGNEYNERVDEIAKEQALRLKFG